MSEEYIKFFSLDMTNITFNTKKLIQYKNSSYKNWKKHNFIFQKFTEHFFIKVTEIKINLKIYYY